MIATLFAELPAANAVVGRHSIGAVIIYYIVLVLICNMFKLGKYIKEIYSNPTAMILLQASMAIFAVWISVVIIDLIVRKIGDKIDNKAKLNSIKNEKPIIEPISKPIVETVEAPYVVEPIPETTPIAEPINMATYQNDTIDQIISNNDFNRIDTYNTLQEDNINDTVQEKSDEEEIEIL